MKHHVSYNIKVQELDDLMNKTAKDLWLNDLDEFFACLDVNKSFHKMHRFSSFLILSYYNQPFTNHDLPEEVGHS